MRSGRSWFIAICSIALISLAGAGLWVGASFVHFATSPASSGPKKDLIIQVAKGVSRSRLSEALQAAGIVQNASSFYWLGRLTRSWGRLKAGEYGLSSAMTPLQVFKVLCSGISIEFPITVHEGDNLYQVADELQVKGFGPRAKTIALCKSRAFIHSLELANPDPPTIEGFLYPETYSFTRNTPADQILRRMVALFKTKWTPERETLARRMGMSRYQVVTLASIIEKETGAAQERPLISSVFENRLRKHMRLESDPTTIYGIWERYTGNLTRALLAEKNDYNTYKIPALPIGPISNPSDEAVSAVLHPAQSEFLFFVSHNDGTHAFSKTLAEHNLAVQKFQLDPAAREGKSWRDLKKLQTQKNPL